jgi:hypothetical protein
VRLRSDGLLESRHDLQAVAVRELAVHVFATGLRRDGAPDASYWAVSRRRVYFSPKRPLGNVGRELAEVVLLLGSLSRRVVTLLLRPPEAAVHPVGRPARPAR